MFQIYMRHSCCHILHTTEHSHSHPLPPTQPNTLLSIHTTADSAHLPNPYTTQSTHHTHTLSLSLIQFHKHAHALRTLPSSVLPCLVERCELQCLVPARRFCIKHTACVSFTCTPFRLLVLQSHTPPLFARFDSTRSRLNERCNFFVVFGHNILKIYLFDFVIQS